MRNARVRTYNARMTRNLDQITRSLRSVWHPCTQMKHHAAGENSPFLPLIPIARGEGAWLIDFEGNRYLDAISSWWTNLFGHANPRINAALKKQLDTLEHTMLAGFTHEPVIELSERLSALTGLGHAFYASDGASANEIALKMSFHFWRNHGRPEKRTFISLTGGYHGETIGALSVTDVAIFRDAYGPLLANHLLTPFPGSTGFMSDGSGQSRSAQQAAATLEQLLVEKHQQIAALILEPLVQGAAGMRMYHADFLRHARALCTRYDVHLIADEIMTGFGRTGTLFAWDQVEAVKANQVNLPDFVCLSKGMTGGYLPLSCVLTTDDIYAAFYHDDTVRGFLHSHSYTGNALACRAALTVLDIFASDDVLAQNRSKATRWTAMLGALAAHPRVQNFRHLGMIWAFEVEDIPLDFPRCFFSAALKRGLLLRPIGNTVYLMPPYVVQDDEFKAMVEGIIAILDQDLCKGSL